MRILRIQDEPSFTMLYLNARSGGGTESSTLPILQGWVDALPHGLDGLLVTSDLQGVVPRPEGSVLLGEALATLYPELADRTPELPRAGRTGVILAGDLYASPDARRRGATGDVRSVWLAFAERFAFAVGVAGNHDLFGEGRERRRFEATDGVRLLDGDTVDVGGLRVGGVSGIIGANTAKNQRKREADFLGALVEVVSRDPDLVVLHEGPDGGERRLRGNRTIRGYLADGRPGLTVCGHAHWPKPLAEPDAGRQILNVDARTVVLTAVG